MHDPATMIGAMRRLSGQFATPMGFSEVARELEQRGLMKFHEWPSGHWSITDAGRDFIADNAEERDNG